MILSNSNIVLITGSAGFIGMHLSLSLAQLGYMVVGIDNLNTYYSVDLKLERLKQQGIDTSKIQYGLSINGTRNISFTQIDITDKAGLEKLFNQYQFKYVFHLAAQAGVRYSIENPDAYIDANVKGYLNILEFSCKKNVDHLLFASSSSVYGINEKVPFSEKDVVDRQVSLYAATKKANESMAHSYASIYSTPITGLRFFTVYGPWGRPDMALFKFTKKMLSEEPIDVYNHGDLRRDFTYIADIVEGIISLIRFSPDGKVPYQILNIGNGKPVGLMEFINCLEKELGEKAILNYMDMQPGDVAQTYSDTSALNALTGYAPKVGIQEGVKKFVQWYKSFYV